MEKLPSSGQMTVGTVGGSHLRTEIGGSLPSIDLYVIM